MKEDERRLKSYPKRKVRAETKDRNQKQCDDEMEKRKERSRRKVQAIEGEGFKEKE